MSIKNTATAIWTFDNDLIDSIHGYRLNSYSNEFVDGRKTKSKALSVTYKKPFYRQNHFSQNNHFTISAWVKYVSGGSNTAYLSYFLGISNGGATGMSLGVSVDNYLALSYYPEHTEIKTKIKLDTTEWFHCALVKDGTSVSVYYNGEKVLQQTLSFSPGLNLTSAYWNGSVNSYANISMLYDEVMTFETALTAPQVKSLCLNYKILLDKNAEVFTIVNDQVLSLGALISDDRSNAFIDNGIEVVTEQNIQSIKQDLIKTKILVKDV